ncbi:hypothetical protein Taro_028154 [Colocasia esculenta]|uniref:non-specific serine/threonine protein kinase n=1 Tax=Colocasia esculenta TaxID=4460 RepID=A0A843VQY2_COLES|nr:hypothetical protein [Colocasia esculenta]
MEAADAPSNSPPAASRHEALLGKYVLGRLLGRGTFAKVYYARSLADGAAVAIKVIDKSGVPAAMQARVLREVAIMSRLEHPHIVRLHEVMATRSKIYLVMEHAGGGELLSLVARRGRVPEATARRYLQQLVAALRFCHGRGIAHRDVKPQNLLLDGRGELKVSDFGLSALPEQLRDDGLLHTACGTPAYTAPEVLRRKGYDGARADAWSCGVILYVMLAGRLPFDDSNIPAMCRKAQRREYEIPSWFSQTARRVVSRLLDPNPDTRMTLDSLADLPWFKKDSIKDLSGLRRSTSLPAVASGGGGEYGSCMAANAFDIISLSSGLDLSGLFEEGGTKSTEKRSFTSTAPVEGVLGRIEEAAEEMGYRVERRKGGSLVMSKDHGKVLSAEAVEVAPPLLLVELNADGGRGGDVEQLSWTGLRRGLGDAVLDWLGNTE